MSARLGANIAANALGLGVTALAGVLSAPLIFRAFGAEAYGLIGVYLMLQALMPLFDLGVTPGLARALAWHRGVGENGQAVTLLRLAHLPVGFVAVLFLALTVACAQPLAGAWMQLRSIQESEVELALVLMASALALRMFGALNRGALMALERQAEANLVQTSAVIARTFGALSLAIVSQTGVLGFLAAQIPISLLEWWWCVRRLKAALPFPPERVSTSVLKMHARFALGIAALAAIWLLSSQVDKIALSRTLHLDDYGRFSLAVHLAMVVSLGVAAIHGAALPRLTSLFSSGNEVRARCVYGLATALSVASSVACCVALYVAGPYWIDRVVGGELGAINAFPVAAFYAIGNVAMGLLGLAYLLQSARGALRLHSAMTVVHAVILVPLVMVLANEGALDVAIAIAVVHWIFVVVWLPIPHRAYLQGGHAGWLRRDALPPAVAACLASLIPLAIARLVGGPWIDTLLAIGGAGLVFCASCAAHAGMRAELRGWWEGRHA